MEPATQTLSIDGIRLCTFEWGRRTRGEPTYLLVHATGFHARCWDQVVAHLGDRHVVAFDQRGHGRSDAPPITHWNVFGRDLASVVERLDLRDVVGVGHSMGGHAMTDAAALRPERFRRLLLIDPVIPAPDDYGAGGWTVAPGGPEQHPTARRKNRFDSAEQMVARFRSRPPYAGFDPACLRDYCTHGLVPAPDGDGLVLACAPATEASVYMTSRTNPGVHESARAIDLPVEVIRAKLPPADRDRMDFSSSPTWPGLAGEFPNGRELFLPDRTHFIPLESPKWTAERILADS